MRSADAPVLISGGGLGGLAAALALARAGIPSQVLERTGAFKEIGAGIQLGPNVFQMFEHLGLTDDVVRHAVFPDALVMMDSLTSEVVTRIPVTGAFRERFHNPYALIHRADLHRVLLEQCRGNHLIALHNNATVVEFAERNDRVTVHTQEGRDLEGGALIGADGMWSLVRERIVGDGAPRISGHIAYRAVLPIEEVPEDYRKNDMILWAGPRNHLVQYPLRGGKLFNLVAVFHSERYEEGWNSYGDPEELHERFAGTCEPVQALLGKIQEWRMWVLCDREPVKEWSRGRVTLLGDAAHPMLQYLAQGAGMAIEDAVVLAQELSVAEDIPRALENYQRARYLRTGRCQLTARLYGEFFHASGVARELRNDMLGERTPEQAYGSMAWIYNGI
jgi:2-polyprenyl-6-methoxyphenol hydroxylase-like FAD-dependent oxidoreductase